MLFLFWSFFWLTKSARPSSTSAIFHFSFVNACDRIIHVFVFCAHRTVPVIVCTRICCWCVLQHQECKRTATRRGWETINWKGKITSSIYFRFSLHVVCALRVCAFTDGSCVSVLAFCQCFLCICFVNIVYMALRSLFGFVVKLICFFPGFLVCFSGIVPSASLV